MSVVSVTTQAGIAIVRVDNPPVNALSHAVRDCLMQAAETLDGDDEVSIVVLICDGRTFFAGADIREFGQPPQAPGLPEVVRRIETARKPWVAAIHGTALGGGFETALGCHYRVGVPSARVGLPEVHLGLLPGAGGTVRLPRLIPAQAAVDMVSSGKPVAAAKALELGIFDALAPEGELEAFALEFAQSVMDKPKPQALTERSPVTRPSDAEVEPLIGEISKRARGQVSPVAAANAVIDAIRLPTDEALESERARFRELHDSDQSKALRHVFFAERQTAKVAEIDGVDPLPVGSAGVIGGGTMGAGIAAACLLAGLPVTMIERDTAAAEAGQARVETILASSRKRGIIDDQKLAKLKAAFRTGTDYAALAEADVVIEAVFEEMAVKQEVFRKLDAAAKPTAILASNTSYMDVNEIGSVVADPARVLGLHFFSPAHVMKLVEVIKTDAASPQTLATGFAFARKLRKTPVLSGVCEGFIGNRILSAYKKQCDCMLDDGALPQQIDAAMRAMGMPMGLFEMADMAGLDIGWATRKRLAATRDPSERYVKIADRLCEMGRFGQKTGAGWYQYGEGSRKGEPDPLVEQIILEESANNGISRRAFSQQEIQDRILDAMTGEGKKILAEGIAQRASDIDMVMILGYGFPRWLGGPMFIGGVE